MVRLIYPVENSQGKWNEIINSDNSKDWKSDEYLRYLTQNYHKNPINPF
jgi:hypothetical protein